MDSDSDNENIDFDVVFSAIDTEVAEVDAILRHSTDLDPAAKEDEARVAIEWKKAVVMLALWQVFES
jgi:hypothetical protein